jgi:hypothetical protein
MAHAHALFQSYYYLNNYSGVTTTAFVVDDLLVVQVMLFSGTLTSVKYYDRVTNSWIDMTLADSYSAGGVNCYFYHVENPPRSQRCKVKVSGTAMYGFFQWVSAASMETPSITVNEQSVTGVTQVVETLTSNTQDIVMDGVILSTNDSGLDPYTPNYHYIHTHFSVSSRRIGWGVTYAMLVSARTFGWIWTSSADAVYYRGRYIGTSSPIVKVVTFDSYDMDYGINNDDVDWLDFGIETVRVMSVNVPDFDNIIEAEGGDVEVLLSPPDFSVIIEEMEREE